MNRIGTWLRSILFPTPKEQRISPSYHIWYDPQTDTASPGCDPQWLAAARATNPRLPENQIVLFYWRVKNDAGWRGGFNKLYLTRSGLPVGWD